MIINTLNNNEWGRKKKHFKIPLENKNHKVSYINKLLANSKLIEN